MLITAWILFIIMISYLGAYMEVKPKTSGDRALIIVSFIIIAIAAGIIWGGLFR